MAKRKKNKSQKFSQSSIAAETQAVQSPLFSKRGLRVILGGLSVVVIGFIVLSFTDPAGQNWASIASPFLLVGGYAMIGVGITLKDINE